MSKGFEIPYDVADGITLAVLQEHYGYLKKELKEFEKNGKWMHPEDIENSRLHLMPSLKYLIEYFGGTAK